MLATEQPELDSSLSAAISDTSLGDASFTEAQGEV
jgi:hypothetical protein